MELNKKAIMVDFLVTVLLAIIIFAPACYVSSKFFRLSNQAKDSYVNFLGTAQELVEKGKENEQKSEILILDEQTALVFFEPKYSEVTVASAGDQYMFNRPSQCKLEANCVCLFQEIEEENQILSPAKQICYPLEFKLKMPDCTPAGNTETVVCSQGFFVGRKIAEIEGARRVKFTLKKEGDTILLTK